MCNHYFPGNICLLCGSQSPVCCASDCSCAFIYTVLGDHLDCFLLYLLWGYWQCCSSLKGERVIYVKKKNTFFCLPCFSLSVVGPSLIYTSHVHKCLKFTTLNSCHCAFLVLNSSICTAPLCSKIYKILRTSFSSIWKSHVVLLGRLGMGSTIF